MLADVLSYAQRFKPAAVIDAATLTGACVIALGHTATGVMGNDDALVQEVLDAAKRAGEPGWPLPLWDDYKELIKSDVADIKNSGGRPAGHDHRRAVPARSSPKAIRGCISTSPARRTRNRTSGPCRAGRPACRWARSSSSFAGALR